MTVGEKIKAIRKSEGLTLRDIGEKMGVSYQVIQYYEADKMNHTIKSLRKIAKALGVPVSALIPIDRDSVPDESPLAKIRTIADHYGYAKQSRQCIEECSELIQALCKRERKLGDCSLSESAESPERTAIIGELADVLITAKQIEYLLSAEDEVKMQIDFKLDRQFARMEEENVD